METARPEEVLQHSRREDLLAFVTGTLLVSLGVSFLAQAKLMTGGVVGLSFLLHYATGLPFGPVFFLINLPFYALAWKKMGPSFVMRSLLSVAFLSAFIEFLPGVLRIASIAPWFAAIMGGLLAGVGLLLLFRHRASLGGFNVLVLFLQDRYGWRAGKLQLLIDAAILMSSIPLLSWTALAYSLLGAVALNLTLAVNHRPGRYMGR